MTKNCSTCGRKNTEDAFQCYACHSQNFGKKNASEEYRAEQKKAAREEKLMRLEEAVESYKLFPGQNCTKYLLIAGVLLVAVGIAAAEFSVGGLLLWAGTFFLCWFFLVLRIRLWRGFLEKRISQLK